VVLVAAAILQMDLVEQDVQLLVGLILVVEAAVVLMLLPVDLMEVTKVNLVDLVS
jgi:hypothetical protein